MKLVKNRGKHILRTLLFLMEPVSMEKLVEKMQFSSRSSLRDAYLKPLRDHGLIELMNPDKPRDPNQRYIIPGKGKMFLGGFEL